jgi:hypothetical protein
MTKDELIKYTLGVVKDALEKHFPENVNKEYIMPEYMMIQQAAEIIDTKFKHIQSEMLTAHCVENKGG